MIEIDLDHPCVRVRGRVDGRVLRGPTQPYRYQKMGATNVAAELADAERKQA